jgi:hypothetical protein
MDQNEQGIGYVDIEGGGVKDAKEEPYRHLRSFRFF